jgi:hypothetical protein
VFILYRHGARSPIYLKDKVDILNQTWEADGQLTAKGIEQLRQHGISFRDEFLTEKGILSKVYNKSDINVISTNYNRTKLSAKSFLSSLYPTENIKIEIDEKTNQLSFLTEAEFDLVNSQVLKDGLEFAQEFKAKYGKNLEKFPFSEYIYGHFDLFYKFCDTFISNEFDDRDLSLLNVDLKELKKTINSCNSINWKFYNFNISRILNDPPLFSKLRWHMVNHLSGQQSPKVVLYFGHDRTIFDLVYYLRLNNLAPNNFSFSQIDFGDFVRIELLEEEKLFKLKIKFNNHSIYEEIVTLPNPLKTISSEFGANKPEINRKNEL